MTSASAVAAGVVGTLGGLWLGAAIGAGAFLLFGVTEAGLVAGAALMIGGAVGGFATASRWSKRRHARDRELAAQIPSSPPLLGAVGGPATSFAVPRGATTATDQR